MSGGPKIANPFKDTGHFIAQVGSLAGAAMGGEALAIGADWLTGKKYNLTDQLNSPIMNEGKGAKKVAGEMSDKANAEEESARVSAYNDALGGDNLDALSRQEILSMYQSGASSADLAGKLQAAREGKGVYGVRKINENMKNVIAVNPGRSQLMKLGLGTSLI